MPRSESGSFYEPDNQRFCPICGKEFYADYDWVYRRKKYRSRGNWSWIWFCSWKCLRLFEAGHNTSGQGERMTARKQKIWQMFDDGLNTREVATLMDMKISTVRYYKDRWAQKNEAQQKGS